MAVSIHNVATDESNRAYKYWSMHKIPEWLGKPVKHAHSHITTIIGSISILMFSTAKGFLSHIFIRQPSRARSLPSLYDHWDPFEYLRSPHFTIFFSLYFSYNFIAEFVFLAAPEFMWCVFYERIYSRKYNKEDHAILPNQFSHIILTALGFALQQYFWLS